MTKIHSYFLAASAIISALWLSACGVTISSSSTSSSANSKIIQQVEAAGSGPIDKASTASLYSWFQERMDLTLAINKQCKEIRSAASAGWRDTSEGRVCEVTKELAVFRGQ